MTSKSFRRFVSKHSLNQVTQQMLKDKQNIEKLTNEVFDHVFNTRTNRSNDAKEEKNGELDVSNKNKIK